MIGVIIPYFKAEEKLKRCLSALGNQTYKYLEVFVRDNSSDNILYTKAINEGLKKFAFDAIYKYVLVLTQDCYLEPNCLEELLKTMDENPGCGIASPIQVLKESRENWKITWGGSLNAWPAGVHDVPRKDTSHETYWANGACMLLRAEMIREIGLMDQNMQFICSDSDYSFTARSRGWKVFVSPKAVCEHTLDGSGSIGKNHWLDSVKYEDMIYFTKKWLSGGLYRELSFEGSRISHDMVKEVLKQWKLSRNKSVNASLSQAHAFVSQP